MWILLLPVNGTLSGPGTVCLGDTVTLTCNITGATTLEWSFGNNLVITSLDRGDGLFGLGEEPPVERSGLDFSFSVLATSPQFVSQLRFVPDGNFIMNGVPVTCREAPGSGDFREIITTAVAAISEGT